MSSKNNIVYKYSIINGKIHKSLENPISVLFYNVSDDISNTLHNYGISPNIIITLRIIVILFAFLYCFENKMYKTASSLYILAFFGDCLNGHMARKNNKNTDIRDYYDNFTDILTITISIYFIAKSLNEHYKWILFIILLLLILSIFHVSCEERYIMTSGLKNKQIMPVKLLCSFNTVDNKELEDTMEFSRMFGTGTYHLFIAILLWNFNSLHKYDI